MDNAEKALAELVAGALRELRITWRRNAESGTLVLVFTDTGPGMDTQQLQKYAQLGSTAPATAAALAAAAAEAASLSACDPRRADSRTLGHWNVGAKAAATALTKPTGAAVVRSMVRGCIIVRSTTLLLTSIHPFSQVHGRIYGLKMSRQGVCRAPVQFSKPS